MKIYELTAIAARIFAICLFLYALRTFASLAGSIGEATPESFTVSLFYFIGAVFIPLIIAVLIWKFPLTLARAFLPEIKAQEMAIKDNGGFLPAALVLLGVYVLSYAIPDLLYNITNFYMIARVRETGAELPNPAVLVSNFAATLLEIVIGFWLILGNAGIMNMIARIRDRP